MSEKKHNISHSEWSKYMECPYKHYLHYKRRIRPERLGSALLFGRALDVGFNEILEGRPETAMRAVRQEMRSATRQKWKWDYRDYDSDLLSDLQRGLTLRLAQRLGYDGDDLDYLVKGLLSLQDQGEPLSENQQWVLSVACRESLLSKATLMIDAFMEKIHPQIQKVISVQTRVKRGILDWSAEIKGHGLVDVLDNKTSSKPYPEDQVAWAVQLACYGAKKAGYVVFEKKIQKQKMKVCEDCSHNGTGKSHKTCPAKDADGNRCHGDWIETIYPRVNVQFLVDEVPARFREIVEESFQDVEKAIEAGHHPRNLNSCRFVGRDGREWPCDYVKLCRENSMEGLIDLEPKKKETKE